MTRRTSSRKDLFTFLDQCRLVSAYYQRFALHRLSRSFSGREKRTGEK
jgi:hypothetical protein